LCAGFSLFDNQTFNVTCKIRAITSFCQSSKLLAGLAGVVVVFTDGVGFYSNQWVTIATQTVDFPYLHLCGGCR
jgi:hypothetical protein